MMRRNVLKAGLVMVFGRRPAGDTGKAVTSPTGQAARRPDQQHRPSPGLPPASLPGNVFGFIYIVGPKGRILLYNPTLGKGNLVDSIAAEAGTDGAGNAYLAGQASYIVAGSTVVATANQGGGLVGYVSNTGEAGPYVAVGTIAPGFQNVAALTGPFWGINTPVFLQEQTGAPATPTGGGMLYVNSTGHLVYLGPSGTSTILANP